MSTELPLCVKEAEPALCTPLHIRWKVCLRSGHHPLERVGDCQMLRTGFYTQRTVTCPSVFAVSPYTAFVPARIGRYSLFLDSRI
jgi:hypothetical protein